VALADELMKLRRELASASSPLARMQMLARSWRSVRQLSPAERKQLASAVGAEGAEGVLDKIAARKGRVGASFLVPALEKFRKMDPAALGRLIDALQDPERRREFLQQSAGAVGHVLTGEPTEVPEAGPDVEAEPEVEVVEVVEAVDEDEAETVETLEIEDATPEPPLLELPAVEPAPPPPTAPPPVEVVPSIPELDTTVEPPSLEEVRDAKSLGRRLAVARELLEEAPGWSLDRLRTLIDLFPQEWARRRIVSAMLESGRPTDTAQAIDLIGSLQSRASRRWCVSVLLHGRQLSDAERQAVSEVL